MASLWLSIHYVINVKLMIANGVPDTARETWLFSIRTNFCNLIKSVERDVFSKMIHQRIPSTQVISWYKIVLYLDFHVYTEDFVYTAFSISHCISTFVSVLILTSVSRYCLSLLRTFFLPVSPYL